MIQELWKIELERGGGAQWTAVADWLKRVAVANSKHELVLNAYGARSETGNSDEFNTAYLVLEFESIGARQEYYDGGLSDEVVALFNEGFTKNLAKENWGHYYLDVFK